MSLSSQTVGRNNADQNSRLWLMMATVVYFLRIYLWSSGELWYDEILTLDLFAIRPENPLQIFQNYSIANNHFLNSVLTWFWIRILNFRMVEQLIRFPAMLFGWGTIAIVCLHWKKFLGRPLANAGAVLLAASPVFGAFAYQLRGYSMMMFLTTLAISGYGEIIFLNNRRQGQLLLAVSSFLLPLTMPSALMAPAVLCCGLVLSEIMQKRRISVAVKTALPCFLASVLSFSYYLMIFPQFQHASRDAGGWPSSFQVLLALLLGFAAHGSIFLAGPAAECRMVLKKRTGGFQGLLLLGIMILPVIGTLILRMGGNAPFPRVYLALLPIFTFALLVSCKEADCLSRINPYILFLAVLGIGCLIEYQCADLTRKQTARAESPQNLLQQYYRGCTDNQDMAGLIKKHGLWMTGPVMVNAYDEIPFRFYWNLQGLPPEIVLAENRLPKDSSLLGRQFAGTRVIARNEIEAARMFAAIGYKGPFYPVLKTGRRILFAQGMASSK